MQWRYKSVEIDVLLVQKWKEPILTASEGQNFGLMHYSSNSEIFICSHGSSLCTAGCLVVQLVDGRPAKAIFHCRGKIKTINTKMHGSSSCCCPRSRSPIAKAIFGGSTLWPLSLLCGPN